MATPTVDTPVVVNDDGSVSMLVFLGRTLVFIAVHKGLMDSTGYKARFGLTNKYGGELIASASTEDGSIVFEEAYNDASELIGTRIIATIEDEDMDLAFYAGKFDMVLEQPNGSEFPVVVGDWMGWRPVTP